jgi:hypothetical protein
MDKWTQWSKNFKTLKLSLKTFDKTINKVFENLNFIIIILIMAEMVKVLQ